MYKVTQIAQMTQISRLYVFNVPQISQIYTDWETYAVEGLKPHHILGTQIAQMTQILSSDKSALSQRPNRSKNLRHLRNLRDLIHVV